jgi:thiol:disulfide interchange protein DsbA
LFTDQAVKDWAKSVGIDAAKFNDVYDSFGIDAKLQRSAAMGKDYGIQFTPAIAVNGRYWTGPSMVSNPEGGLDYPRFFNVVDQLIDMERPKAAAKKKSR